MQFMYFHSLKEMAYKRVQYRLYSYTFQEHADLLELKIHPRRCVHACVMTGRKCSVSHDWLLVTKLVFSW